MVRHTISAFISGRGIAGEAVRDQWRNEPGEGCHRERGSRPYSEDSRDPQLWNLHAGDASVGADTGRRWH